MPQTPHPMDVVAAARRLIRCLDVADPDAPGLAESLVTLEDALADYDGAVALLEARDAVVERVGL